MARTVLFIDYEPRSIGLIRPLLRTLGLHVYLARDGLTGIDMFHAHDPDLVLVQDLIPLKHGFEVCREIKNSKEGGNTPVILIATMTNGRRREIPDTGCDAYLKKPVQEDALVDLIRKFLPEVDEVQYLSGYSGSISSFEWQPVPFEEQDIDQTLDAMISLEQAEPKRATRKTARKTKTAKKKTVKKKTARKANSSKKRTRKSAPKKRKPRQDASPSS